MKIISSYQVEILSNTDMKHTVQIYRKALIFVINICNQEWNDISTLDTQTRRCNYQNGA